MPTRKRTTAKKRTATRPPLVIDTTRELTVDLRAENEDGYIARAMVTTADDDPTIEIGCQSHTLSEWRKRGKAIVADNTGSGEWSGTTAASRRARRNRELNFFLDAVAQAVRDVQRA